MTECRDLEAKRNWERIPERRTPSLFGGGGGGRKHALLKCSGTKKWREQAYL